jgi:hypothetical protein
LTQRAEGSRQMKPVKLTIQYKVGDRTIRKRLGTVWTCPLCTTELEPEEGVPASAARKLICPSCGGTFRIVQIETGDEKPKRPAFRRTTPKPHAPRKPRDPQT